MIKIITPGAMRVQSMHHAICIQTFRATCTHCRCEFTYENSDTHTDYVYDSEWVSCPTCGRNHTHIEQRDGPWGQRASTRSTPV